MRKQLAILTLGFYQGCATVQEIDTDNFFLSNYSEPMDTSLVGNYTTFIFGDRWMKALSDVYDGYLNCNQLKGGGLGLTKDQRFHQSEDKDNSNIFYLASIADKNQNYNLESEEVLSLERKLCNGSNFNKKNNGDNKK